ncbi:hypothetical protein RKD27_000704 [Streptomyces sp. SAI-126]
MSLVREASGPGRPACGARAGDPVDGGLAQGGAHVQVGEELAHKGVGGPAEGAGEREDVRKGAALAAVAAAGGGPLEGEGGGGDLPALARPPDPQCVRDPYAAEEDLVEGGAAAHLPDGAHLHSGGVHRDQEGGDAGLFHDVRVGAGEQEPVVGELGSRGPHLLAVDHPHVAVATGAGAQGREVGSRAGFAEELAGEPVGAQERAGVLLALLVRSEQGDGHPDQAHGDADQLGGRRHLERGLLLGEERRMRGGQARAALVDGERQRLVAGVEAGPLVGAAALQQQAFLVLRKVVEHGEVGGRCGGLRSARRFQHGGQPLPDLPAPCVRIGLGHGSSSTTYQTVD